jgi:hypothetical protein
VTAKDVPKILPPSEPTKSAPAEEKGTAPPTNSVPKVAASIPKVATSKVHVVPTSKPENVKKHGPEVSGNSQSEPAVPSQIKVASGASLVPAVQDSVKKTMVNKKLNTDSGTQSTNSTNTKSKPQQMIQWWQHRQYWLYIVDLFALSNQLLSVGGDSSAGEG